MAQYVDLTSKEWCDLVFEGKNKEFGAYEMRLESPKRHNKAVFYTIIGLLIVAAGAFGLAKYNEYREQQRLAEEARQQQVQLDLSEQKEEEKEEEQVQIEEKKPEIEPEQEIAQQKVTELAIVADEKVKEEPKSQTELEKTEEVFTAKNVESDNTNRAALENLNKQVKIDVPEPKKEEKKPEKEEVFKSVEQMPTFPGGDAALMKWLSSHIQYPTMAQENNVQGRVVVQFVVTKTGQVGEVKVVRSVDKDLDREAVRVCKSLPKFVPGRQNGQAVNVWYTLPVTFKLQGTN